MSLTAHAAKDPGWGRLSRLVSRVPRLLRDLRSHPGWFLFFLFGRLIPARRLVTAAASWRSGPDVPTGGSCRGELVGPPVAAAVNTLRQDGICPDLRLSEAAVAELQTYARSHPCYGGLDWRTRFSFDEQADVERRTGQALLVGHFPDTDRTLPGRCSLDRPSLAACGGEWLFRRAGHHTRCAALVELCQRVAEQGGAKAGRARQLPL
ncbi:hypothetical protein [Dankookia sp. P2]|uniref:hypothetical protein n=1 Tax=Dankookia sp. P2 TaxID=3423955 RepID=UPI003D66F522